MGWVGTGIAFVVTWWLVLFMVLPWRVRKPDNPEVGHEPGAPENPRLWLKVGITTGITVVLVTIMWFVADAGWITIRDKPA